MWWTWGLHRRVRGAGDRLCPAAGEAGGFDSQTPPGPPSESPGPIDQINEPRAPSVRRMPGDFAALPLSHEAGTFLPPGGAAPEYRANCPFCRSQRKKCPGFCRKNQHFLSTLFSDPFRGILLLYWEKITAPRGQTYANKRTPAGALPHGQGTEIRQALVLGAPGWPWPPSAPPAFLLSAVLAVGDILGGYSPFALGFVAASGPGAGGFLPCWGRDGLSALQAPGGRLPLSGHRHSDLCRGLRLL